VAFFFISVAFRWGAAGANHIVRSRLDVSINLREFGGAEKTRPSGHPLALVPFHRNNEKLVPRQAIRQWFARGQPRRVANSA